MRKIAKDITGEKFNKLTAIKFDHNKYRTSYWVFRCDCGIEKIIQKSRVINGYAKSCGCIRDIRNDKNPNYSHGMSNTRLYRIWASMITRCTNTKILEYKNYGGRGIKVCDGWLDFINFRDDMYESYLKHVEEVGEKDTSIDRIDNNLGYYRNNCKWSTREEQSNNVTRNIILEYNGIKKTLYYWAKEYNIKYKTLINRIKVSKLSVEDALNIPIKKNKKYLYNGVVLSLSELSKKYNINYSTLSNRINSYKWQIDKVIETPIKK